MHQRYLNLDQLWIDSESGEVYQHQPHQSLAARAQIDPKGIALLLKLVAEHPNVCTKDTLMATLWPNQVVTDETLARTVSRLRAALGDTPKSPSLIETLPKRGYRLIAQKIEWQGATQASMGVTEQSAHRSLTNQRRLTLSAGLLGVFVFILFVLILLSTPALFKSTQQESVNTNDQWRQLVNQADDYYLQMRQKDNEMAIELYQRAAALRPDKGEARAGLANTLVQKVIRHNPSEGRSSDTAYDLERAINDGLTKTPTAIKTLDRALNLAQSAVKLSPLNARTHKALGFVRSAQSEFEDALQHYERAINLNPDAWDALINTADVLNILGRREESIAYLEQAFAAMQRKYDEQSAQIQPWYADMGAVIGERYNALDRKDDAETWFRRVLNFAPFNLRATVGLADLLNERGALNQAQALCQNYAQRIGANPCSNRGLKEHTNAP